MSLRRAFADSPRPAVLLLGWLGSRDQHFNKYARLYQDLGAQVIAHQPSILQTALPDVADRALLRFMRDVTYRYSSLCTVLGDTPPVLVHAMSNAGFIAYGTMLHLVSLLRAQARPPPQPLTPAEGGGGDLEFDPAAWRAAGVGPRLTASRKPAPADGSFGLWGDRRLWRGGGSGRRDGGLHPFVRDPASLAVLSAFRQVLKNTQGIVIDSAPSQANVHIWSRGLLSAALAEPAAGIEEAHPLLLRLSRRLAERYLMIPAVAQRLREVRHAWQYAVPPCPQLYLYSRADALIPHHHIEQFMEQEAAHGIPVHHHCWDDTPHCEHFRKHPEQYRSLVRSFMEHCCHSHTMPEVWI
ncbi:hypothetical protein ABPG77_001575 [Micractinium sp. CCAP 211/92]